MLQSRTVGWQKLLRNHEDFTNNWANMERALEEKVDCCQRENQNSQTLKPVQIRTVNCGSHSGKKSNTKSQVLKEQQSPFQ